jgi:hypothetical protein
MQCSAFPNGIPDVILYEGNDHSSPLKAQKNNIVYDDLNVIENTPLFKNGGASNNIEPYKISTDSKDYLPKKKILKSAVKNL